MIHTKYVTIDVEGDIVGEWRKGLAIFKEKDYSYRDSVYYLINDKNVCVYEANYEKPQLYRIIGGHYIVKNQQRYNFRTFPGQDHDTEYDTRIVVRDVLDENGKRLKDDCKREFLKTNQIDESIELGEGIAFCNNSFYRVDNYTFLFKIDKDIQPVGKFINGKLRVNVTSDFRDFIVLVHQKKIIYAIPMDDFVIAANILDKEWNIEDALSEAEADEESKGYDKDNLPPDTVYEDFIPKLETYIDGYLYDFPREYRLVGTMKFVKNKFSEQSHIFIPSTAFFHVRNKWIRILDTYSRPIFEEAYKLNQNAPNFIKTMDFIKGEVTIDNKVCEVYRFQCRPFGDVHLDGKFNYDFNVKNIKW